jgi:hypothetical protein
MVSSLPFCRPMMTGVPSVAAPASAPTVAVATQSTRATRSASPIRGAARGTSTSRFWHGNEPDRGSPFIDASLRHGLLM